jgi:Xaa-Pro aminopeptidase
MLTHELTSVTLPDFGMPIDMPSISKEEYEKRIHSVQEAMRQNEFSHVVIYADREHSANIAFLCRYEPRFEEALLIIPLDDTPILVVGNEGIGYTGISPLELKVELFQSFSLLGQDRSQKANVLELFDRVGIGTSSKVGVAGWKYFTTEETRDPSTCLEIPSYLVDTLRALVASHTNVINVGSWFMNETDGFRCINSVDQLAYFEFAACHTSSSLLRVLKNLKPGITELELASYYQMNGLPLCCHPMVSAGDKAFMGLSSPSTQVIEQGTPFTTAYGVWGALNCRQGWIVSNEDELPDRARNYASEFAGKYFAAIAQWYETVGIGIPGSTLYDVIHRNLPQEVFHIGLNPGHLIHLDEWVHSPIYKGSPVPLRSGMALQVDVIPSHTDWYGSNIEDGIALADESLRMQIKDQHPAMWSRIEHRRQWMQDTLHIHPKPEVLPFSNIQAFLPPYLLNLNQAFRIRR